jgi:CHAD domain-containing protein
MLEISGATGNMAHHARSKTPSWKKARLPVFTPETTAAEALAEIVLCGINHLRGNEACVLARAHEEGVHQMRVATRRLRSSLSIYKELLPADERRYLVSELKWLIGELGPARDWDVFLAEVLAPVIGALPDEGRLGSLRSEAEGQRDHAYERAQAAIRSDRYIGLALLLSAWARGHRWHEHASDDGPAELFVPATVFVRKVIDERYQEVLRVGEGFESLTEEKRHALRIQLKKLRYAAEFFGSLYAKKTFTSYLAALKSLQDDLGANNDLVVAQKLLAGAVKSVRGKQRVRLNYAAGVVVGWHSQVADGRQRDLSKLWERFRRSEPFWSEGETAPDKEIEPAPDRPQAGTKDPPA